MLNAAQRSSILNTANRLSGGEALKVPADQRAGLIQDVSKELESSGISKAQVREALFEAWTGVNEDKGQKGADITGAQMAGYSANAQVIKSMSEHGFSPLGLRMAGKSAAVSRRDPIFVDLGLDRSVSADQAAKGLDGLSAGGGPDLSATEARKVEWTDRYYDVGDKAQGSFIRMRSTEDRVKINVKPKSGNALKPRVELLIDLQEGVTDIAANPLKAFGGIVGGALSELESKEIQTERRDFAVEGEGTQASVQVEKVKVEGEDPRFHLKIDNEGDDPAAFQELSAKVAALFDLEL